VTEASARPLPAGLRAFRHRDFRLFWSGQAVSLVGTWMQSVAQAWLVLELTGSAFRLGLVGALQFSPMLAFGFLAGALSDRMPKRQLIMVSQSVMLAQALALALLVAHGHVEFWHVAVMATVYGVANTLDIPARQAFMVELVGRDDLMNAIALNSALFNGARIVGPAVAGVVIARWGLGPAFFLNALSFVAVLGALLAVRARGLPRRRAGTSIRAEIAEGVGYALRTPRIALTLSLVLVVSAFLFNYSVIVPLLARDVLGQEAEGFGLLMAMVGIGAIGAAVTLAMLGRGQPPLAALVAPALVLAAAMLGLAAVRMMWLACLVLAVMGYTGILVMAGANTTLQLTVPDELRGRVMSLHMLVFAGITPVGNLLMGALIEGLGVPGGVALAGGAGLVSVLGLTAWWRGRSAA
jgi:MFS family permease